MLLGPGEAQAEEEDVLIGLESSELARLLYVCCKARVSGVWVYAYQGLSD